MSMTHKDIRILQRVTLTGEVHTLDMTNGREGDENEMLPEGMLFVGLLIKLDEQVRPEPQETALFEIAPPAVPGVWMAYYSDRSGLQAFASEIEALRCAVGTSMDVIFLPFATPMNEVI